MKVFEFAVGDLIFNNLPYSGLYVTGTLISCLTEYIIDKKDFLKEYRKDKAYLDFIFDSVPIYVIKDLEVGLLGGFAVS